LAEIAGAPISVANRTVVRRAEICATRSLDFIKMGSAFPKSGVSESPYQNLWNSRHSTLAILSAETEKN